jgi:Mg2+/Co2+ transporter CorB
LADASLGALFTALGFLILLSACFSASETAMMALNRYRLRHLVDSGHRGAKRASRLLERPDRLLGVILLGNNFANIAASSVATVLALELWGEAAIAAAAALLTIVVLIFAEVAPKTLAALYPERVAFPAAYALQPLLLVLYPVVWVVNTIANGFLRLLGISLKLRRAEQLTADELRSVVREADAMIPVSHQTMLLRILDLEKITVDDIMVPRSAIEAIDLDADWDDIVTQLATSHHTRLPVYRNNLDNIIGLLHLRKVLHLSRSTEFNKDTLIQIMREPYFIPEGTPVTQQLINMQTEKRRFGLVVDEYGDLKGLVTLDEILEEIVGEFTTQAPGVSEDLMPQDDGSYIVNGTASVRDLNRKMGWELPTEGPKTLNGLILEYLEDIPESGTSLLLGNYAVEILQTAGTAVKLARIMPRQPEPSEAPDEG